MRNFKISILQITIILLAILPISCNDNGDNNECNTICTEEFRTIVVSIKDQNQQPIALDSFQVINTLNGDDVTISLSASGFELAQQNGQYPITEDGKIHVNQEISLLFKGFINGSEVISSNYTVMADCCHVNLISGNIFLEL